MTDQTGQPATRIAMWSGPRNISTALMRSWESRADTYVCDEPLYAHYLAQTGASWHPGYEQTLAQHETDYQRIVAWLTGPTPSGKPIFYQKHMAHHLLPGMDLAWMVGLRHALLIREPRAALVSMSKVFPTLTAETTGLPQQAALYERLSNDEGLPPPIVDARDILLNPPGMLRRLCEALEVSFDRNMLSWAAGPRPTDGAWAPYFYEKVYRSTRFSAPASVQAERLPAKYEPVLATCEPIYRRLYDQRLTVD